MLRDDALRLLRGRREELHALGVGQLFLYGSVARNEAQLESDVDLLVEPVSHRFLAVPNDVQYYLLEGRVAIVPVRAPSIGAEVNLHVAGSRRFHADLYHRTAKIRAGFVIFKTRMKHPDSLSV